MIYQGKAFKIFALPEGIVELRFDLEGESVNKFNQVALEDLDHALTAIESKRYSGRGVQQWQGKLYSWRRYQRVCR